MKFVIAFIATFMLAFAFSTQADAWTLADCQAIHFNHPDCVKYLPSPTPTHKASPTPTHTAIPTPKATPTDKDDSATPTPRPTAGPVQTPGPCCVVPPLFQSPKPAINSLPSTSTN